MPRCAVTTVVGFISAATAGAQTTSPTKGWPVTTPQAVGLNPRVLDSLDKEREIDLGWVGFGGRIPMTFPDDDLVVVFNGWNILPGQGSTAAQRRQQAAARGDRRQVIGLTN